MFGKCDSSNRHKGMVASLSISETFAAKFKLIFALTQENTFCERFHFKNKRKSM